MGVRDPQGMYESEEDQVRIHYKIPGSLHRRLKYASFINGYSIKDQLLVLMIDHLPEVPQEPARKLRRQLQTKREVQGQWHGLEESEE